MMMSTCRLCGDWTEQSGNPLVKYGIRHYCHIECGLKKWGSEFFDKLSYWQCMNLPYLTISKMGFRKELAERTQQS